MRRIYFLARAAQAATRHCPQDIPDCPTQPRTHVRTRDMLGRHASTDACLRIYPTTDVIPSSDVHLITLPALRFIQKERPRLRPFTACTTSASRVAEPR